VLLPKQPEQIGILSIRLGAAYGTKGGLWARLLLASLEHLCKGMNLFDSTGRCFRILRFAFKPKGRLIMFFAGIDERSHAESLKGLSLYLPEKHLPSLEKGAFYTYALVGCSVFSVSGNKIGRISSVANFGAGDLLEVKVEQGRATVKQEESQFFVPFQETFVLAVDAKKRKICVADDVVALFGPEANTHGSRPAQ
jgi:16S rRNA processing protein RimM